MDQVVYGSFAATGAAVNLSLGWIPAAAIIINETDGTTMDFWINGMAAGKSVDIIAGAGPVTRAANGVTTYAGDTSNAPGLTLGSGICTNAKTIKWVAWRGAAPFR